MTYAPYTDTTLYPAFDISTCNFASTFHLGFIVADKANDPSWGGFYKVKSNYYDDIIGRAKTAKKDLIISFGGAAGKELSTVCKSPEELYVKYKFVIDKYKATKIDFDIEGVAIKDKKSNSRRALAIHLLKQQFPTLKIILTVPVMPFGLDLHTRELIDTTPADIVNIMAMDFGGNKQMGLAVLEAIKNTKRQTNKPLGVTVMIGENDTGEIFKLSDAKLLKNHFSKDQRIKFLSIWSIERDLGKAGPLSTSSKIDQKPFDFSKIFQ